MLHSRNRKHVECSKMQVSLQASKTFAKILVVKKSLCINIKECVTIGQFVCREICKVRSGLH